MGDGQSVGLHRVQEAVVKVTNIRVVEIGNLRPRVTPTHSEMYQNLKYDKKKPFQSQVLPRDTGNC